MGHLQRRCQGQTDLYTQESQSSVVPGQGPSVVTRVGPILVCGTKDCTHSRLTYSSRSLALSAAVCLGGSVMSLSAAVCLGGSVMYLYAAVCLGGSVMSLYAAVCLGGSVMSLSAAVWVAV